MPNDAFPGSRCSVDASNLFISGTFLSQTFEVATDVLVDEFNARVFSAARCGFLGAQAARAGPTLISDSAGMPSPAVARSF